MKDIMSFLAVPIFQPDIYTLNYSVLFTLFETFFEKKMV
jgi:hypothetical protein